MKKLFLLSFTLLGLAFTTQAQDVSDHAIGLRLGDSDGFGAEISYQLGLSDTNRIEFDLGWRDGDNYNALRAVGLYQWVMPMDGNFNWYVGAGGGFASYNIDIEGSNRDESSTSLLAAGNIGIEYDFDIPLLLSLDFRPEIGLGDFRSNLEFDIALGIRYQF